MTLASGPRYQHVGIGNTKISRRVPKPTQKTCGIFHLAVEYTHFLALGDGRTGSLRLLPFCLRHLTYFCWQPIRAQLEVTWHWRPFWREANQTGKMAPKNYVWSNAEEDRPMDLLEDNDCLYQLATKGNSNRQQEDRIFFRISRQFEGQRVSTVLSLKHV